MRAKGKQGSARKQAGLAGSLWCRNAKSFTHRTGRVGIVVRMRTSAPVAALVVLAALPCFPQAPAAPRPHNVILFVADGLRRDAVNEKDTPALWRVRKSGMDFPNSHSV